MSRINLVEIIRRSFRGKLLLFTLSLVVLTVVALFLFLMNNFRTITDFSLEQNTSGMQQTVEDYLTKLAQEKSTSIWLQIKAAQDNLVIMGKTAQKIIDNYDEIKANPELFQMSLFQSNLVERNGAFASSMEDRVDILIPPEIAAEEHAKELLTVSSLLNLSIDAVYEANPNNVFLYYVGEPAAPVTRAYPNIDLATALGEEGLKLLFWRDFFSPNVPGWQRWYTDPALQAEVPSPVTVEAPYQDAAGQGTMVTMFYPLWNKQTNTFAGAVGVDITLNNIIQNILSTRVAKSGFAFLMNGKGEIIAIPEAGNALFEVNTTQYEQGGLTYYTGSLTSSTNARVKQMADTILSQGHGVLTLNLEDSAQQVDDQLIAFDSLPALSTNEYEQDQWKIVMVVPESEIFEILYKTDSAIREKSLSISLMSLILVIAFLLIASYLLVRFSTVVTQDLKTLAVAAEQVSAKNYNVTLALRSQDEIGQLGRTFEQMNEEIRNYTTNLEQMVTDRTMQLQQANVEISRLNEQLQDENLRLSAELDVARQLQMMVLPHEDEIRSVEDLDIACFMHPANEVGGDYYDILNMGDTTYLCIGDVTGHGLPSGVIMLMAETTMMTLSQSALAQNGKTDLRRGMAMLNKVLYKNILRINENKNMTMAVVQYHDRAFNIVGQHESVIVCRTDGRIEVIDTIDLGLPIGLADDIEAFLAVQSVCLEAGDVMVLYTDGVTEAENGQKDFFGIHCLTESLSKCHHLPAGEILEHVRGDIFAFIGQEPVYDDISMVVIKQK